MKHRILLYGSIMVVVPLAFSTGAAFANVIYLTNGSQVVGTIV